MKIVVFIIVIQVVVTLLAGCSAFEHKLEQNQELTCSPSYETLCAGWAI